MQIASAELTEAEQALVAQLADVVDVTSVLASADEIEVVITISIVADPSMTVTVALNRADTSQGWRFVR